MTQSNSSFPEWAPSLLVELIRETPEQIGQNNRLKNLLSESRTLCSTSSQDAECSWAEWIKQARTKLNYHDRKRLKQILANVLVFRGKSHSRTKDEWEGWFTTAQEQLDQSDLRLNEKRDIARALCSNPGMKRAWLEMKRRSLRPALEIEVISAIQSALVGSKQKYGNTLVGVNRQADIVEPLKILANEISQSGMKDLNQPVQLHTIPTAEILGGKSEKGAVCFSVFLEVEASIERTKNAYPDRYEVAKKFMVRIQTMLRPPQSELIHPWLAHLDSIIIPPMRKQQDEVISQQLPPFMKKVQTVFQETGSLLLSDALLVAAERADMAAKAIKTAGVIVPRAHVDATSSQQNVFLVLLGHSFSEIFGSPLYGTLAKVASSVFDCKITVEQVRRLCRARKNKVKAGFLNSANTPGKIMAESGDLDPI